MPEKLDRCISQVKNDHNVDNPWAVCQASSNELEDIVNGTRPLDEIINEGGVGSGRKPEGGKKTYKGERVTVDNEDPNNPNNVFITTRGVSRSVPKSDLDG